MQNMKQKYSVLLPLNYRGTKLSSYLFFISITLFSCGSSSDQSTASNDTLSSRDTSYKSIAIDGKIWFSENLHTAQFRNGDKIPYANSSDEWIKRNEKQQPAYAFFNFDSSNYAKFGMIYNWYAINDPRNVCPIGWSIPSEEDWNRLALYCDSVYGKHLDIDDLENSYSGTRELLGITNWDTKGTNQTSFNALPGGYIDDQGACSLNEFTTGWWSYNQAYPNRLQRDNPPCEDCAYCFMVNSLGKDYHNVASKGFGLYVRCISEQP
jgi:uncharacterized protein (TIGR02145 family)